MDDIKRGDKVFVQGALIAQAVGTASVDCLYRRPNGSSRILNLPREILRRVNVNKKKRGDRKAPPKTTE